MDNILEAEGKNESGGYGVQSKFDIEKHKAHFIDYLEVVILPNGEVQYAVPSHTTKAELLCMEKLGVTREELWKACPPQYMFDYLPWLLSICGAVSVWNTFYTLGIGKELTRQQYLTLKELKMHGLFKGTVTRWRL